MDGNLANLIIDLHLVIAFYTGMGGIHIYTAIQVCFLEVQGDRSFGWAARRSFCGKKGQLNGRYR